VSFGLALLGTFLVRSGVLTSVHAFAVDPKRGVAVLVLMAITIGTGFTLYALRVPSLARATGFAAVSREGFLVLNNLGLAVAAGTVLVGTLYPLAVEAIAGRLISVGPPFFNLTFAPLMAALLIAMPFAPMLAWRRGNVTGAWRTIWIAAAFAGAVFAGVLFFRSHFWAAVGLALGAWLLSGALLYVWARWARGGPRTLPRLLALPIAVWAVAVAHAGAGVFAIGAMADTSFRSERSAALVGGQSVDFANRRITLLEVADVRGPNYRAARASIRIEESGGVRLLHAERRYYDAGGAPTTEVGIAPSLLSDLYVALGEPSQADARGAWIVRLYHNPLVHLIFLGAAMIGLGGILGLAALARARALAMQKRRDDLAGQAEEAARAPVVPT
jgi:cytochrome c-type biogenesis protein CcmF